MFIEFIKFIIFSMLIVLISKYLLVNILRKLSESLKLKSKTVGNIAGIATSVPELLTVSFSAYAGLIGTSIYNILSSNVINLVQYLATVFLNKNQKILNNKALRIDIILVLITIIIPIFMVFTNLEIKIEFVPVFILLFILFYFINNNAHKLYLEKQNKKLLEKVEEEKKWIAGKKVLILKYSIELLVVGIILYIIGNLLSQTLEELSLIFKIPEFALGILLGVITSIPELITFFESQKYYKNQENIELGVIEATNNLLTSNILNLFIIHSIGILIFQIFNIYS